MEDEEITSCYDANYGGIITMPYLTANANTITNLGYSDGINPHYSNYTISARLQCVKVIWTPKEDITTYELAKASPLMIASCQGSPLMTNLRFGVMVKDLDSKTLRHFDIEDPSFEGVEWDVIK
jgi:hypothetical protein